MGQHGGLYNSATDAIHPGSVDRMPLASSSSPATTTVFFVSRSMDLDTAQVAWKPYIMQTHLGAGVLEFKARHMNMYALSCPHCVVAPFLTQLPTRLLRPSARAKQTLEI